jgi:peroxiredoxin
MHSLLSIRGVLGLGAICVFVGTSAHAQEDQPPSTSQPAVPRPVVVIEGQCVDVLGAGVKDVKVVAVLKTPAGEKYINTGTTNELGDFAILASEALRGTATVTMTKWGFKTETREVQLAPGELPPFVDVQFEGAVIAFGIVTDAASGAPIANATVRVEAGGNIWMEKSGPDGRFRVAGLAPGAGIVTVEADGYGRTHRPVRRFEDFGELIILLRPGLVLSLRVVEPDGKPVAGVSVECYSPNTKDYRSGVTDESGRFRFAGLHVDTRMIELALEHEQYVCTDAFERELAYPENTRELQHEVVMIRAGSVSGRVIDATSNNPLSSARIMVGSGPTDMLPKDWSGFDGEFKVTAVPPGAHPVTVHLAGYGPELKEVTVEAGRDVPVEFQLAPERMLGGVVVDADGAPVPGAYVGARQWRSFDTLGLQAMTTEQGEFAMDGAPADPFTAIVMCRGYGRLDDVTLTGGKMDHRIVMKKDAVDGPGGPKRTIRVGDEAPAFELVTLDGKTIKSADLRGKWVLLDFWATWCGPCVAEIPNLKAVRAAWRKNAEFVMISVSLDDDEKALRRFIKQQSLDWYHVFGKAGGAMKAADSYGAHAIPLVILIGPTGRIVAIDLRGAGMKGEIERQMKNAVPPEPKQPADSEPSDKPNKPAQPD